jgi:hypothetical protein
MGPAGKDDILQSYDAKSEMSTNIMGVPLVQADETSYYSCGSKFVAIW